MNFRLLNHAEQTAAFLKAEILRGRWSDEMPGADKLAQELGVNHTTIGKGLQILEGEELLINRGIGRKRRINLPKDKTVDLPRIAILDYDKSSRNEAPTIGLIQRLADRGFSAFYSDKCLADLKMDIQRISRMVGKTEADAWIILSAPRSVLNWFREQDFPTLALFGACENVGLAAVSLDYHETMIELTQRAIALGHRRIVFIARRGRKEKKLGHLWRSVLDEIEKHGIPTGDYNLPQWEDSKEGFHHFLTSLFLNTPPTALFVEEIPHFIATLNFCNQRGIKMPNDISLACLTHHPYLDYSTPSISHVKWDEEKIIRRIFRWADNIAMKKCDQRLATVKTELVLGDSLGQAK